MRGKPWSIDEERQLRKLIEDGKGMSVESFLLACFAAGLSGNLPSPT